MTDDPGVKNMLKLNLARDTLHQNLWLKAIEELQADDQGGWASGLQPDGQHQFGYLQDPRAARRSGLGSGARPEAVRHLQRRPRQARRHRPPKRASITGKIKDKLS
jgi:Mn-containing catalase